jgi:CBS domain-containing protein
MTGGAMATVRDILSRKGSVVVSVTPDTSVLEAARLMNTRGIGAVLVLDGDRLAGIFTERDVLRRVVAEQRDSGTVRVRDVMTSALATTTPEATIDSCAAVMTTRRIRHLPVLEGTRLIGVVTTGDLMAFQVSEQADTIAQLNSYVYDNR